MRLTDDILTMRDYKVLMRALRHLPPSERQAFGAVINKLKDYVGSDDDFINDFNRFYEEGQQRRKVEKIVRETVRHMNVPQDEVRMGANWYGDMNDD